MKSPKTRHQEPHTPESSSLPAKEKSLVRYTHTHTGAQCHELNHFAFLPDGDGLGGVGVHDHDQF